MKPELSKSDQGRQVSPHSQEIEYALILQRMINAVQDDPEQMRMTIYEFARARLKLDTSRFDESERERLSTALETAIRGVDQFLMHRGETELLSLPDPRAQVLRIPSAVQPSTSIVTHRTVTPAPEDILLPTSGFSYDETVSAKRVQSRSRLWTPPRIFVVLLLCGIGGVFAYYEALPVLLRDIQGGRFSTPKPIVAVVADAQPPSPNAKPATVPANAPSFPVPSDYGVYALNENELSELHALPERVPDKRIAVSTPVDRPSRTTLPGGKARFIVFRRDLAGTALDRMEVRVVARVARAISFDTKGRPSITAVSDAWNIRNVSYEFRVRPIAGNPEMVLVQSDKADFSLPAGRYVLVLKDQGYDFAVAGNIAEPAQCLERTDAANGAFYSECLTP